jgi:hypothetical protein
MSGFVAKRLAAAAASMLLLAACGGSTAITTSTSPTVAAATCVAAPVHTGAPPGWTAAAWADSSPGLRIPYSLASGDAAAAFWFAPRLRAGHPDNPSNKVLWVVHFPRNGHPLEVTARLGSDPTQIVRVSWPADSSPGEIYPSDVDLPRPGCWRLQLAWGSHRAIIDVQVHPRAVS